MTAHEIDDAFRTFRRTRDPQALARVFDEAAPRLMLVAVHLVEDRADAEDLVQATFVQAIESADAFDPSRPVVPWLTGILANRARLSRRRRRRRLDRDRIEAAPALDPADAAEASELAEHVQLAIDGLPQPYRHALILHLVHGLGGAQIARSLGRSPETVRTQLRRGLEMLRRALPVGLSLPVLLAATSGRGLAAVRAVVLERAAALAPPAVAGAVVGGTLGLLLMKNIAIGAIGIALVGILVFGALPSAETTSPVARDEPTGGRAATVDSAAAATGGVAPAASTPAAVERVAAPDPRTIVVRGRCVAAEDGSPVRSAIVEVFATRRPSPGVDPRPTPEAQAALPQASPTGADGAFTLRFVPFDGHRYSFQASADDRLDTTGLWPDLRAGQEIDVGLVPLHRGVRVALRVVDEREDPVPGVAVLIEARVPTLDPDSVVSRLFAGRSRADGGVTLGHGSRLPPGSWPIELADDRVLVRPRQLVIPEDRTDLDVAIVVRAKGAGETIDGRVVDELGSPVAGVRVLVERPRVSRREWTGVTTDGDGRFTLFRADENGPEADLVTEGDAAWLPARAAGLPWGREGVELRVRRARSLELEVAERASGRPVERFGVVALWSGGSAPWGEVRFSGLHEAGRLAIPGIARSGQLVLVVVPEDGDLLPNEPLAVALQDAGPPPVRVALERRQPFVVEVRRGDGTPVAGSRVQLAHLGSESELTEASLVLDAEMALMNLHGSKADWRVPFELDAGTTDASGRVRLRGPTGRGAVPAARLALRVTGDAHAPAIVHPLELPAPGSAQRADVVVEVAEAASLRGVVRPLGLASRFSFRPAADHGDRPPVGLALRRPGERSPALPSGAVSKYPIAADGTFEIEGIPAGRWELVLLWSQPVTMRSTRTVVVEPPLAVVELAAGTSRGLEVDATRNLPGAIHGQLLERGELVRDAVVTFTRRLQERGRTEYRSGVGGFRTDAEGRFVANALAPGDYHLAAEVEDPDRGTRELHAAEWVTVVGGRAVSHVFVVASRTVRVRVLEPDGAPLRDAAVTALHRELRRSWDLRTDANGQVAIPDAPAGELSLRVDAAGVRRRADDGYARAAAREGAALDPVSVGEGTGDVVVERRIAERR